MGLTEVGFEATHRNGLRPANERRRYKVTPYLIGWAQTKNQPWPSFPDFAHVRALDSVVCSLWV